MPPNAHDLSEIRRKRIAEIRRHALAMARLIDDIDAEDIEIYRAGDVVQILDGHQHARTLLRVTRVDGDARLHGYLLASSRRHRSGGNLCSVSPHDVHRVGNAPIAIDLESYPLPERPGHTLDQYAEIARKLWIEREKGRKAKQNAAAKTRRKRDEPESGDLELSADNSATGADGL